MGKAGRWLRSFLSGKKDKPPQAVDPPAAPKDKRWSFRRPPAAQEGRAAEPAGRGGPPDQDQHQGPLGFPAPGVEFDQKKHAVAVAAAAVARLSSRGAPRMELPPCLVEDAAAVRIQATFRGYLVPATHSLLVQKKIADLIIWITRHDRLVWRGVAGADGSVRAEGHREAASSGAGAAGEEAGQRHAPLHAGAPRRAVPPAGTAHARAPAP